MAEIEIKFEFDGFPMNLKMGGPDIKTGELLKQIPVAIKGVKGIGGKAPGVLDTTHACAADYFIAEKGTTPDTRRNTYYKIYGANGTWVSQFGVAIWKEVLDPLAEKGILPARDKVEIGKEYLLDGYTVVFETEESTTTPGKLNPKRVIELIKS